MAKRIDVEVQRDFNGGLNVADDVVNIAPNQSFDLMDVDIDRAGGFGLRRGRRWFDTGSYVDATSIHPYTTPGSVAQIHYGEDTGPVRYRNVSSTTETTVALAGSGRLRWTEADGNLYLVGRTDSWKYDGASYTALGAVFNDNIASPTTGNMPAAKVCATWGHCVWIGNVGTDSCRIRWSHPGKPESWRTNDWIDLDPEDGHGSITALVPFGERLLVFKERAIYAVAGYAPNGFSVQALTTEIGVASQEAVVATEDGIFFWDRTRGAFAWDGRSFHWIFRQMQPLLDEGRIERGTDSQVTVEWFNERAWFSVPWAAAPYSGSRMALIFYPMAGGGQGAWTIHSDVGRRLKVHIDSTGKGFLLGFSEDALGTWRQIEYDVLGLTKDQVDATPTYEAVRGHYTTRWFDAKNSVVQKRWKRPEFLVAGDATHEIIVDVMKDYNPGAVAKTFKVGQTLDVDEAVWDTSLWDQADWAGETSLAERAVIHKGPPLGNGRAVALRFSSTDGNAWKVYSMALKWIAKRLRN